MSKLLSRIASPTGFLYIFVAVTQVGQGVYLARQVEPPGSFTLVYFFGFLWIIGWWLREDSRKRGFRWIFDTGLFLYVAWPIVMPYYLLKTRGVKGLLVIVGFVGACIAAWIVGITLYLLLAPAAG